MFLEASAKLGENVDDSFVSVAVRVLEQVNNGTYKLNDESHGIKLGMQAARDNGGSGKSGGCC